MARSTPKIIVMPAATRAYIDPVMMPLTICSKMKESTWMSLTGGPCALLGAGPVVPLRGDHSLDDRLGIDDLDQRHRQDGLVVVIEGHLAHRAFVVDAGQRV